MNNKVDPNNFKTCEICGKYYLGSICNECTDNQENEEQ